MCVLLLLLVHIFTVQNCYAQDVAVCLVWLVSTACKSRVSGVFVVVGMVLCFFKGYNKCVEDYLVHYIYRIRPFFVCVCVCVLCRVVVLCMWDLRVDGGREGLIEKLIG